MGQGGEIFVFDMGKPVKILDLAKKMIRLAGLKLNVDIHINFTGLRPGEKLYEELLAGNENTLPTHNDKIMIGQVRLHDFEEVNMAISELLHFFNVEDNEMIVARMKDLVPEFISKNSVYELLDDQDRKTKEELLIFQSQKLKEIPLTKETENVISLVDRKKREKKSKFVGVEYQYAKMKTFKSI
jgi:hypothetical protein